MNDKEILEEIVSLDEQIFSIVKQRSSLLAHIRTKGYILPETEKVLRKHWEEMSSNLTKDNAFVRTFFKILQQVEIQNAGDLIPGKFLLTPSKREAAFLLHGFVNADMAFLALLLSTSMKTPLTLNFVNIDDSLFSTIKMLQSLGASLSWEEKSISLSSVNLDFHNKIIHLQSSEKALYAALALSTLHSGYCKYVGDLTLELLNVRPIRDFLMCLGIRITSLKGTGLPIRVESVQQIPQHTLEISESAPLYLILTLFAVAPAWGNTIHISFMHHKDKEYIREIICSLYSFMNITHENSDYSFTIFPTERSVIATKPIIPLDPYCAFLQLLVPYFTSGYASLQGTLSDDTLSRSVLTTLENLGLSVSIHDNIITSKKTTALQKILFTELPEPFFPLLLTVFISYAKQNEGVPLPSFPQSLPLDEIDSFLETLSIERKGSFLLFPKNTPSQSWVAPSAYWIVGYAYVAFIFPSIILANPSDITQIFPHFWRFYNALPSPQNAPESIIEKKIPHKTTRRLFLK
ncbi:MAG: hypothetical protein ACRCV3_03975 [Desulfovibrionaceae bacterium]